MPKKSTKKKASKKEEECSWDSCCKDWKSSSCGGSGCIYILGVIGAAVFYIQQATGFWMGVYGILKALVWPAILVYKLLGI